jgi:hypothetical protein
MRKAVTSQKGGNYREMVDLGENLNRLAKN